MRMSSKVKLIGLSLLSALVITSPVRAASEPDPTFPTAFWGGENKKPEVYTFPVKDGLYATVTSMARFQVPKIAGDLKLKLKPEGFHKEIEVRVLAQKGTAPLAVLLGGWASRSKAAMTRIWQTHLHEAGYHVLTFDSVFVPSFNERSRHGVAGHLIEEAKVLGSILKCYKESNSKVSFSGLYIMGGSYGGLLALNYARLMERGEVPLKAERIVAYSPPVNIRTAALQLDKYHAEDRWNYTLVGLAQDLLGRKPVPFGDPVPFTPGQMRAGLAAAFYLDLAAAVESNDRIYKLKLLPGSDADNQYRRDKAATWSFQKYMEKMVYPYWKGKGKLESPEALWAMGDLSDLLKDAPSNVHVVLTMDDPLNDANELSALLKKVKNEHLTVLPTGGHMGYFGTEWAKSALKNQFTKIENGNVTSGLKD